ncbi:MAG: ParB protein [Magnetococcales bacterium]|nr:ParB protein [Magnetococcales bacterium]HIJ83255.1 ParB/RepB/Spo0J family partition protein [Magnetococcales bacterium]
MTAPSSRLGRGLGSLLGEEGMSDRIREVSTLSIDRINPNKDQPRRVFDQEKLTELANSLKEKGMLQPVLVRKLEDGSYQIIAGERRWRAAQIAGMQEIPVIEKKLNDAETLEISLLENIQREDLNPVEQARAFERLVTEYHYSHKQVGDSVGKSRMAVSNTIRILKLPPAILQHLELGRISTGHARALLARIDDENFLEEIVEKIVRENLSVREIEKMVSKPEPSLPNPPDPLPPPTPWIEETTTQIPTETLETLDETPTILPDPPSSSASVRVQPDPTLAAAETRISQRFGVAVAIQRIGGKRRIVFECENEDTLQRLVDFFQQDNLSG